MSSKMTPINPESLAFLAQIASTISDLSGTDESQKKYAEDLYEAGMSMMLAMAPSPAQHEWNKIQRARVRIGGEHLRLKVQQNAEKYLETSGPDELLTPEEEDLYQRAIGEETNPFRNM